MSLQSRIDLKSVDMHLEWIQLKSVDMHLEWVDNLVRLLKGYKTSDFDAFVRDYGRLNYGAHNNF